jgi:HSP20 family protein
MEETMNIRSMVPDAARRNELSLGGGPFGSLQREINRLFDDAFRGFGLPGPAAEAGPRLAMDVKETDQALEVTADLPGVDEKDIEVTVSDGTLVVRAEKKAERESKDADYHLLERSYGSFYRALPLPFAVDADKVAAVFDKGVLKLTLPKPPEAAARPKKIEIKAGK